MNGNDLRMLPSGASVRGNIVLKWLSRNATAVALAAALVVSWGPLTAVGFAEAASSGFASPSQEAPAPIPSESTAVFEKAEVVYADLSGYGQPIDEYVVNRFDVEEEGMIVDYGQYESTKNLTDTKEVVSSDGANAVHVDEGTFFYQGNLESAILPWDIALSYAWGVGGTRSGVIKATFKEETEEDLFGEQAVLCGGLVELVKAGFETLVDAGYPPELAYFECYHEMKMIVDLMYESGIHFMNYSISNTAEYGEYYAGPKVINEQSREAMREILGRIQDGSFAKEFVEDCKNGHKWLLEQRAASDNHLIEQTGEKIRGMFSWLSN